jgi:hypothetical protein
MRKISKNPESLKILDFFLGGLGDLSQFIINKGHSVFIKEYGFAEEVNKRKGFPTVSDSENSFDFIFLIEVFEHTRNFEELFNELLKKIEGEKYKNLTNFLKSMDTTKLNTWELEFCNSVIEKLNNSEEHILLSNKQHQVLVNIHKKHGQ